MAATGAAPSRGTNNSLIVGIVLAVVTFWLFAQTTLNVAPTIRADLQISESLSNIAVSITALFSGIFIVVAGGLADRFGRVKLTYVGLALSALGSLLVALSPAGAAFFLMTGRIIQGLSAACIMPATLALLKDSFDGKERQRAVSFWSIGSWGGSGLCALFGGLVASSLGWRWIFWMSIAVAAVSAFLLKDTPENKVTTADRPRFDWFGFLAFIIAMVALNIVIGQGDALGWLNPTVIGLALVFGIAAVVFLRVEAGRADGFVDLTLFENRTYAGATLSNFLLNGAAGTLLVALALVQQGAGLSSFQAGLLTLGYLVAILGTIRVGEKLLQQLGSTANAHGLRHHRGCHSADNLHVLAGPPVYDRRLRRIHALRRRRRLLRDPVDRRGAVQCARRQRRRGVRHLQDGLVPGRGARGGHLRGALHRSERSREPVRTAVRSVPRKDRQYRHPVRSRDRAAVQRADGRRRDHRHRSDCAQG
jgi:MFS family permease